MPACIEVVSPLLPVLPPRSVEFNNFTAISLVVKKSRLQTQKCLQAIICGATGRIRTGDLLITNQLLYQLSHSSIYLFVVNL